MEIPKINGLERYIYYIVKNSRLWVSSDFRNWNPEVKFKHYLMFSNFINEKFKLNISISSLFEQVLLATDNEWQYVFEAVYDNNMWPYELEGELQLQSDHTWLERDIENESMNLLGHEVHPELHDYTDEIIENAQDDYVELSVSNEYDEAKLKENRVHPCILMPEWDRYLDFLNQALEEEQILDAQGDEDYYVVSNAKIADDMKIEFSEYLKTFADDQSDTSRLDMYLDMLCNTHLTTWLQSKGGLKNVTKS